jgi:hypothetical protein
MVNALVGASVVAIYLYTDLHTAIILSVLSTLFIATPAFGFYLYYKALRYAIGRKRIMDCIQIARAGNYARMSEILFYGNTPINPELFRLPSVSYLHGFSLRAVGYREGNEFVDYGVKFNPELHNETQSHNFSVLETQYQTEAEKLSQTLFFNSLNRFNLLELVAWVFAGLMIARLVFFLISLT